MKTTKIICFLIISSLVIASCNNLDTPSHGDAETRTDQKYEDLLATVQFAGIELFKTRLNEVPVEKTLTVYLKEFSKDKGESIADTILLAETTFYKFATDTTWTKNPIESIEIYTQREYETSEDLYIQARISGVIGEKKRIRIPLNFNVLHSWRTIRMGKFQIGKEIPILLYGSWWDDTLNGRKVKRFCSAEELNSDLSNPELKLIPHYYLVCLKVD